MVTYLLSLLLKATTAVIAAVVVVLVFAADVGCTELATDDASDASASLGLEADAGIQWLIREDVQNGLYQAGSGDEADDIATGFNLRRARLGLIFESADRQLGLVLRLRLEERTDILDCYGSWRFARGYSLDLGQMKIPSLAETLTPDRDRDFIYRSLLATHLGDLALTRTPYISSIMGAKSYDRDLGIALKTSWETSVGRLKAFVMLANGLGAGKFVGGESGEFLYSNGFGDFFYGGRLDWRLSKAGLGVFGSLNRHQDVALGARGPVYDIDRRVYGLDGNVTLPAGFRLAAFYGHGNLEDFWASTSYIYEMSGAGIQAIKAFGDGKLELCLRWESLQDEFTDEGSRTELRNLTAGLNFRPRPDLRLQLNYVNKVMDNDLYEDVMDDILSLYVQYHFSVTR